MEEEHNTQAGNQPKWVLIKTKLEQVEANTIKRPHQKGEKLRLTADWNYHIKKMTKDMVVLSASCRSKFVPEGFFDIYTEYTVVYRLRENVTQDEIKQNIEKLLSPAGEQNALMVAQLTDKMRGGPVVIPPQVKISDGAGGMNLN